MSKHPSSTRMHDPAFWRDLAPALSLDAARPNTADIAFRDSELADIAEHVQREGYLCLPAVFGAPDIEAIRAAILALADAGLPPVFIYMYDQPWTLFSRLSALIGYFLGERFALLPNFWAWNIPVTAGAAGWPVHRDAQAQTRFGNAEGSDVLMSLSLWIPMSAATLDNGCMYVLPRTSEATAFSGDRETPDIDASQGVALPAPAGSVLGWAQDVFHWSGAVSAAAREPRISLSFEFQNPAFAPLCEPLLDIANPPDFAQRLNLITQQFEKYQHMETTTFQCE